MTDTATDARVSVHDLRGDELDEYIASHIALWGYPPLAGGAPDEGEDEDTDDESDGAAAELARVKADRDKWKAHAQKHEKRAKENADAATELERIKDEGKTETQKAADKAAAEAKRATNAESRATRLEVALDKAPDGMPLSQVRKLAKRLSGDTREELESDADELFADFKPGTGREGGDQGDGAGNDDGGDGDGDEPRRRPRERLKSGAAPNADPEDAETNPEKLAAQVPRFN